jgi:hypothetical protein
MYASREMVSCQASQANMAASLHAGWLDQAAALSLVLRLPPCWKDPVIRQSDGVFVANWKALWPKSDSVVFKIGQIHGTRMLGRQVSESLRALKRIVEATQMRLCLHGVQCSGEPCGGLTSRLS